MKLQQLIDELQQIAHMGHAQDEVLFTDLTNSKGTRMIEALRPRLLGYTACDGTVSLRIEDEQAPDGPYAHPRITCAFCNSYENVQPLYKFTDSVKVWKYVRNIAHRQLSENSYVCEKCAKAIEEGTR